MSYLNKLAIHLNDAAQEALKKGNQSLDQKLFAYLKKMMEPGKNKTVACPELLSLCDDVVYFVLNGTDVQNNERAFVAALNVHNLAPRVLEKTLFEKTEFKGRKPGLNVTKTFLFSTQAETEGIGAADAEYINKCWNLVWEDYLDLTENAALKERFTFNHWLLNKTKNPLNVGLYWGEGTDVGKIDESYFSLPVETLEKLGAEQAARPSFNTLQLPSQYVSEARYDEGLTRLQEFMSKMNQRSEKNNSLYNIGFAAYHVIRSYGCWGGSSFYSIPVYYGSETERNVGIISLCSKKPLSEEKLTHWTLVANLIFKDIIVHEINRAKDIEQQSQYLAATYSLGHNLKNRVLDADTKIAEIRTHIDHFLDGEDMYYSDLSPADYIKRQLSDVSLQIRSLANTGNLLDLIAKAMTGKHSSVFALKESWHSRQEITLTELLSNFYGVFSLVSKDGKYGALDFTEVSDRLVFTPLSTRTLGYFIRPADFIYEEIFFELYVNALNYGRPYEEDGMNYVDITVSTLERNIIVENKPEKLIKDNEKFNHIDDGVEYPAESIGHGGLLYISNFLKMTDTGSLSISIDRAENKFRAVLRLDHLYKI